jgi:phosphatidylserine/phosphatidylglycerophosphate/cardiolipin synthase-like enzyme/uncharacterized membrane protein YdjX (TVP38/TMEM64 family)
MLIKPGRNVWRSVPASRCSFLIDGDAFFRSFSEAALNARQQIIIVGWDTDTRTEIPHPDGGWCPLSDFLNSLVIRRPELNIYVLSWDYSFIYLLEREQLPTIRYSTAVHDRVRFVLDQEHPFWGCHHQKIVVIDDKIAFSGGLDITARRWDTREHRGTDERRTDPWGNKYGPFHDVQLCVDGQAAKCLGELVRERWQKATGETLPIPGGDLSEIWPKSAAVDMQEMHVGISRTVPGLGIKSVIEVEKLFLDMIRHAKKFIYIENQYFTSPMIAKALIKRLREVNGPEIVLILPRDQTGWIEEKTMGQLFERQLRRVQSRDLFGHFHCFYPIVPALGDGYIKVHSKVMLIDNELVRIGSANLNNRSMGLDSECDLVIESEGRPDIETAIANLRASLLSEHLGVQVDEFKIRSSQLESMIKVVESFQGGERTLIAMNPNRLNWVGAILQLPEEWIDSRRPKGIRRWLARRVLWHRNLIGAGVVFGVLIGLLMMSEQSEQKQIIVFDLRAKILSGIQFIKNMEGDQIAFRIREVLSSQDEAVLVPIVLLGFVVGSLLFIPITALIMGVGLTFSRSEALMLSLFGVLLALIVTYGIGRFWAWTKSRFLARPWIQALALQLQKNKNGLWAVVMVRILPVAPFTVVSLVAGGLRIPILTYLLGSLIGMVPGIIAMTFISGEAVARAKQADWYGLVLLGLFCGVAFFIVHRLSRRRWKPLSPE